MHAYTLNIREIEARLELRVFKPSESIKLETKLTQFGLV